MKIKQQDVRNIFNAGVILYFTSLMCEIRNYQIFLHKNKVNRNAQMMS